MQAKLFAVYIVTNPTHTTLYTGFTQSFPGRILQHREKLVPGFSTNYNCYKLVYVEFTDDLEAALTRERQIKGWRRSKKDNLIAIINPRWRDLLPDYL